MRDAERKQTLLAAGHAVQLKKERRGGKREGGENTQRSKCDVQILEGIPVLLVRVAWISHIQDYDSAEMDWGSR